MSTQDILLIIAAVFLGIQNAITAWKVQAIKHSVNSAATAQTNKVEALTAEVATLTKSLADEKMVAERLAHFAGPPKRSTQRRK